MTLKKFMTILILISVIFCAVPSSASSTTPMKYDSSVESFLSVMTSWGTFLARVTGSYAVLEQLFNFSKVTRAFNNLIEQKVLSPAGVLKYMLRQMGIDFFTNPYEQKKKILPEGTFSI